MSELVPPEASKTMAELRIQIDAIDVELVTLLARRSGYIDRAVDLKKIEGMPARTTDRVAQVLDKVSATATQNGLDSELVRKLWSELIEWSIQHEIRELGP